MDLINFDNVEDKPTKHHFLLPDCHYMMIGQTGCGKTNTLLNMLLRSWLKADRITIYTINPEQDKYQMLQDFYGEICSYTFRVESPEDIEPIEEVDREDSSIIIFDDIKLDKKNMTKIKEYFSLSRNRNCNCIYLCQSYYDVPKYIRRNTKCFLLFKGLDNRDIQCIAHDHASGGLTKPEFVKTYQTATEEPYSFFTFDKTAKHLPEMYRRGFNSFLMP